jgi:AraC-like DNA-binding protein
MTGCANRQNRQYHDNSTPDVKQAAARVMELAADRPEQALQTIDSLRAEGMAAYETDWLRAKVYCQSLEGTRLDSAIAICERLILLDVARENREYRQDVLETLVNACRRNNDDERILRWTAELVTLFHENGDETEALRSEAEMGVALTHTGHLQEGLAKIDSVIAALGGKRKFNELDASLIALKRKVGVLCEAGRHADIIPVTQSMLDRLADYEQHPDDYRDGSYREPADENRAGYIDFYRNRAYGYLAEAYAWLSGEWRVESVEFLSDATLCESVAERRAATATDSARHYLALYEQSGYGRTQAGRHFIVPTLCLLGETAKMDSIFQDLDEARFRDYEQQMEIEREQDASARKNIIIGFCILLVLLVAGFAAWLLHQRSVLRRTNQVLVSQIAEAAALQQAQQPLPEEKEETVAPENGTPEALFRHMQSVILREQLYLDPAFDRQAAIRRFNISKERVGSAFAQSGDFSSISDFIRDCRLRHACDLLLSQPQMTVSEVAQQSGFIHASTFSTDFKNKYLLTPTAYREANK